MADLSAFSRCTGVSLFVKPKFAGSGSGAAPEPGHTVCRAVGNSAGPSSLTGLVIPTQMFKRTSHRIQPLAVVAVISLVWAVALLGMLYLYSFGFSPPGWDFSVAWVTELIRGWGFWGVAGSIFLMVLHSFVPFPAEILAIANGMVFGPFWGALITWAGAMLGAYLAFSISRLFGRSLVQRLVPAVHWQKIDQWSRTEGGAMLLLSRFIPVIAFNLLNYGAGLTSISWWTFTWATGLGILPLTVVLSVMGGQMTKMTWGAWTLVTVSAVLAWVALQRLRKR